MSTLPTVDAGTLGWVKSEIEDTASQARKALQQFEDNTDDKSAIKACSTHLHQIYGTLTMVELDAAARLVLESENFSERLSSGSQPWTNECGTVLRRAIDDLSSYLEALQSPPGPSPLRLAEPINRLLVVQNIETISDHELFTPDLSARVPEVNLRGQLSTSIFLKLVDDLRVRFERSLLNWLRDTHDREAIQEFTKVFKNMVSIESRGSSRQLWWISGGLSELMLEGTMEVSDEVRFIMAKINQQLKSLQDTSQSSKKRAPPDDLIKRILLLLAQYDSRSSLVAEIKKSFGLDDWVNQHSASDLPDIEALTKRLYGFASEAESDLEQAQNLLARYFSPQGKANDVVGRLYSRIESLQIAAKRNDLGVIEQLLGAMVEVVVALRKGALEKLDQTSLQMAGALLFIQDSASGQLRPGPEWHSQAEASVNALIGLLGIDNNDVNATDEFLATNYRVLQNVTTSTDVIRAAANEIRSELQYVEHSLELVANKESPLNTLLGIDGHLKRVEGTFEILEHTDAAELSEQLRFRLNELASGSLDVSPRVLDAVAMAVGTLSACANTLEGGGSLTPQSSTVQRAVAELAEIDYVGDELADALSKDDYIGFRSEPIELQLDVGDDTSSRVELGLTAETKQSLSVSSDGPSPLPVLDDDLDEIVQIFYAEALEVDRELGVRKEEWRNSPEDHNVLMDLRRCFHTLKGSGRFAEASSISELSWTIEQLLNAIMDGDASASPQVHDFIDRVHVVLAELIATNNPKAPFDLEAWTSEAKSLMTASNYSAVSTDKLEEIIIPDIAIVGQDVLAENEIGSISDVFSAGTNVVDFPADQLDSEDLFNDYIPADESAQGVDSPLVVDNIEKSDRLLQQQSAQKDVTAIFKEEMLGHIEKIARNVKEAREQFPDWRISPELLRISHTLKGVTRSMGLNVIARMSDAFDNLLIYSDRRGGEVEEVDLVLIDQSGRLLRYAMTRLDGDNRLPGDVSVQFDELANAFNKRLTFLEEPSVSDETLRQHGGPDGFSQAEDVELLEAFREEGQEILSRMESEVQKWETDEDARAALAGLRRELHTLKGGARAVGWSALGDLGHSAETLLEDESQVLENSDKVISLIQEVHDLIAVVIPASEQLMLDDLITLNRRILNFDPKDFDPKEVIEEPAPRDDQSQSIAFPSTLEERASDRSPAAFRTDTEARSVRVSTEVLDELVNYSGEVSILRSRLQQQLSMVRTNLGELNETVRHFREQMRDLEIESEAQMLATSERIRDMGGENIDFDPLELDRFSRLQTVARSLGDSLSNLVSVQAGISEFAGDAENTLQQQAHISDSLQEGLLRTRMIPFASVVPRLRHLTRQTGRQLERHVRIVVTGEQVEVDRKILDQMSASFEHMIRNAIVHGFEDAELRAAAGKPEEGLITMTMEQDGNDIVINFMDDGSGIDRSAIENKARTRGLLPAGQAMTDEDLMRVLTTPGLSTATDITQLSGRGVGMDVVADMIRQLGGSITVSSEKDQGTTFTLRVPVTLAISHALLVYAGEQMFALPARLIFNVLRVPVGDVMPGDDDADAYILYNDERLPVLNLAQRLGLPFFSSDDKVTKVVVVRAGIREIAIMVESVSDTREIVVKPLNEMLSEIPGIGGVTMLGDGSIVLILDIPDLWQHRTLRFQEDTYRTDVKENVSDSTTVMVVDDSMTVRNVMGRDLQNNGYEVILAKDGVDAIEQLRHTVPDILLVDLEMPRMDGFELTGRVRSDERLRDVPILIITSRSGARHRDQAMILGANGYMSKPYRLDELVGSINDLTNLTHIAEKISIDDINGLSFSRRPLT